MSEKQPWFRARPGYMGWKGETEAKVDLVRRGDGFEVWNGGGCSYDMTAKDARELAASLIKAAEEAEAEWEKIKEGRG